MDYICMFSVYLLHLDWICHHQWTEHEKNKWDPQKGKSSFFVVVIEGSYWHLSS